jgi:hypothetical protein
MGVTEMTMFVVIVIDLNMPCSVCSEEWLSFVLKATSVENAG